ncbi:MAG: hypothetical protein HW394_1793 [Acidobacteria bacterium]|nr:hypothetical protein [Acidobacteriota bacterium]
MKRLLIVLGVALTVGVQAVALAQARPDFSGTWRFNQGKSNPGLAGNTPSIPFPSQIVVKQTATDLAVDSSSVRQQPLSAVFKLDGSKVTVQTPSGITETGEAKFEGANVVITTRRSFSSPAGETVVNFREVWSLGGNALTIEKTRTEDGESSSEKAVFDKM